MKSLLSTFFLLLSLVFGSNTANGRLRLSEFVIRQYPEMLVDFFPLGDLSEASSARDESNAYALGMFLAHSKPKLFTFSKDPYFPHMFAFNLSLFVEQLKLDFLTNNITSEQVEKRSKLAMFCSRVLDLEKFIGLSKELSKYESIVDGSGHVLVSLKDVHEMIAQSSKSPFAVVAIDVAILRYLSTLSKSPQNQTAIYEELSGQLCSSLFALRVFSKIHSQLSQDIKDLLEVISGEEILDFEFISKSLIGLVALLPEGDYRRKLTNIVLLGQVGEYLQTKPDTLMQDLLTHPLMERSTATFLRRIDSYVGLRDAGVFKVFLNGCPGSISVNYSTRTIHPTDLYCYHHGKELNSGRLVHFSFATDSRTETTVLVASVVPLGQDQLDLVTRYVRGELMSESDMHMLIYLQAAYGIFAAKGQQITMEGF